MKAITTLVFVLIIFILSACVYVPRVNEGDVAMNACRTYSKSMSLEQIELLSHSSTDSYQPVACNGQGGQECAVFLAAGAAIVVAGSAIVSGTIVVVNNTAHWMEYQGTCSDGYLNQSKQWFLDSINKDKSDGKVVVDLKQ